MLTALQVTVTSVVDREELSLLIDGSGTPELTSDRVDSGALGVVLAPVVEREDARHEQAGDALLALLH